MKVQEGLTDANPKKLQTYHWGHSLGYLFEKQVIDVLTFMETYRPQNLNIYVTFDIESDLSIEKTYLLRPDRVCH